MAFFPLLRVAAWLSI